jgi:hypothetical protein
MEKIYRIIKAISMYRLLIIFEMASEMIIICGITKGSDLIVVYGSLVTEAGIGEINNITITKNFNSSKSLLLNNIHTPHK